MAGSSRDIFPRSCLNFPATDAHLVRLELRDKHDPLLSENFYWHTRDEHQLQQMNSMPEVVLSGKTSISHGTKGASAEIGDKSPQGSGLGHSSHLA
jgi:hypothetical protein